MSDIGMDYPEDHIHQISEDGSAGQVTMSNTTSNYQSPPDTLTCYIKRDAHFCHPGTSSQQSGHTATQGSLVEGTNEGPVNKDHQDAGTGSFHANTTLDDDREKLLATFRRDDASVEVIQAVLGLKVEKREDGSDFPFHNKCPGPSHKVISGSDKPNDNCWTRATGKSWLKAECCTTQSCRQAMEELFPELDAELRKARNAQLRPGKASQT